jgi:hypothetical protein
MSSARDLRRHAAKVQAEARAARRPTAPSADRQAVFAGDPIPFAEVLVNPETGEPFVLYEAERQFLREALTPTAAGALPYPELLFSAPKKSGKTTLAAIALLYVVRVIGGRFAEGFCVANDFDQAAARVFRQAVRIIEASPLLRGTADVTADMITFPETGATITALPSDYAGAAGSNPAIVVFDELWAYTSERARRLWDELVPVPTRAVSVRLTVTYAGFADESVLLEGLHRQGLAGEEIGPSLYRGEGLLMAWHHEPVAPWQTAAWLAQMRRQLRPSAYLRMIENRFTSGESSFVEPEWWAACEDAALRPVVADRTLSVWVGVDASVKRDSTAIVAVTWDRTVKKVRLVWHRIFQPSPDAPLDFEATIEATLREMNQRFCVEAIRFDPWQMAAVSQRLTQSGLPMQEYPQTVDRLTAIGTNLYELVKGGNLAVYPDATVRQAIGHAVARETPRGWRLAKEKASHKIDVVVALAMAAHAAVEQQTSGRSFAWIAGEAYDLDSGEVARR